MSQHSEKTGRLGDLRCVALTRPVVVVADLHLAPSWTSAASGAFAALLQRHPGAELVCAGDSFNLSVAPEPNEAARRLTSILRRHPNVRDVLRQRLLSGLPVTLVAGNHDAVLVTEEVREALEDVLEVSSDAPLAVNPWFVRRGQAHIEHGHLYDPDNAPVHPLAPWSPQCEPLGVALTRRVLAPTLALALTHAHETTPLAGLGRTLRLFGPKGLAVIARYFGVSACLCWEAATGHECDAERRQAERELEGFAAHSDLTMAAVQELLRAAPSPTHRDLVRTFRRLYLDRASAAALLLGAAGVGVLTVSPPALTLSALAAGYLVLSRWAEGTNRYAGLLEERLRAAARTVAELSDATLVVFGHTHREDAASGYLNPGAFGLPDGEGPRYVLIGTDGMGACLSARVGE